MAYETAIAKGGRDRADEGRQVFGSGSTSRLAAGERRKDVEW